MENVIGTVKASNQTANIVKVDRLVGYRFDAVGKESLPLAVDLAIKQAREMSGDKEGFLKQWSR